ncbi:helix-turn-helix domain-containing protein [Shewanella sp. 1_MG-2023]|uniref:helix-turn-helix domain-containing protein n=1 Tax=unclassified Shewanella TaxID=196818 RepID=UPI000C84EFE0|nr:MULTISPECIES: helix-turn-helix domain-containing protein [unclassified Shewanella]MDO6612725.1 helix-turn-helix domain-containing protein [Shewanella sp. 7_MG-2023]MDO6772686.1 helix-turn-helix domain-containing protein [Shewanella sp. 2_MG-2023]MDO6794850.1 helix-turn-helix domain-containing protein [Shewanella sp. 1_MG-2023]PMG75292.1 integrase [Shewanella sp. 10N.286.51.B7]
MNSNKNEIRSKLALLQLATELGSISKACDIMGYSRDSYYRFKKQYEEAGERGLKNLSRKKPALKNRVSQEVEDQVIEIALDYPNYGQAKAAELLTARGCTISASGVRTIWVRHNLETKKNRLVALNSRLRQQNQLSFKSQHDMEQLYKLEQNESALDCKYPGDVCVQDTFSIGNVDPMGQLYQHTFIDAYSQYAIAIISDNKDSSTAANFLQSTVQPWYMQQQIKINSLLTDRGAEFSGKQSAPFKDLLDHADINHIQMRAYNGPVVNGLAARFQQLTYDEFYAPFLKNHRITTIEELNQQLQKWLDRYNHQYAIAGRYTLGKTAVEVLQLSKHLTK